MRRISVLAILAVTTFLLVRPASAEAQFDETFATLLHPGFNLIGWTEPTGSVDVVFAELPQATALFAWDPLESRFHIARREGPAILNDLDIVERGSGLWIQIDADAPFEWQRPAQPPAPAARLWPGNNLIAWTGPDAAPITSALAPISASLISATTFDAETERFLTFAPILPGPLNDLSALKRGEAVWLRTCRSAIWDPQEASPSSATLPCTALDGQPVFEFDQDLAPETSSLIHEAIRDARSYFVLSHALDTTAFTVRAFADTETLLDTWVTRMGEYRAAAEQRWSGFAVAFGNRNSIWIHAGGAGWAVGTENARHSSVMHEFFHVLQGQMGESRGPEWLFEGSARYAEFVVAASVGREDLGARRAIERARAQGSAVRLSAMETLAGLNAVGFSAGYSNGYLAAELLSGAADLSAILDFYRLSAAMPWRTAFEQAFGQTLEQFYARFEDQRVLFFAPLRSATLLAAAGD